MYNLQYLVYVDFNDILYQDMLNEDIPLPKPEKMTLGQITSELELRGLSTTGLRSELNGRLTQDDLSKAIDYLLKKKTNLCTCNCLNTRFVHTCISSNLNKRLLIKNIFSYSLIFVEGNMRKVCPINYCS